MIFTIGAAYLWYVSRWKNFFEAEYIAKDLHSPFTFLGLWFESTLIIVKQNPNQIQVSYEKIAHWYKEHRCCTLFEKHYLDLVLSHLNANAKILDLGCGFGRPIANYFIDQGFDLIGVDSCDYLIQLAKINFPKSRFLLGDMRELDLHEQFDAIIVWDSFFHLTPEEQKRMFPVFKRYLKHHGLLLFTTGPEAGEVWSDNGGELLYHASLSPRTYKSLLQKNSLELLTYKLNDSACENHSVWLAQKL